MKPVISVIVPIYNSEKYLKECIDSILNQSFKDFELILIDDGSVDCSGKIADEYARKDERIIVIHQENKGVSVARNNALDIARGDYISFIDSDDIWMTADYLKLLYDCLNSYDADHAKCKVKHFTGDIPIPEDSYNTSCITGRELLAKGTIGSLNPYLINRKNFKDIRFPEGLIVEDNAIIYRLFSDTDKIAIVNMYMYGYRKREDSQSGKQNCHNLYIGTYYGFDDRIKYYEKIGETEKAEAFKKWRKHQLAIYFMEAIKNNTVDLIPKEIHLSVDELIENLKDDEEK